MSQSNKLPPICGLAFGQKTHFADGALYDQIVARK